MTERKCVELTAIYSDGTVVRMTGDHIMVSSVGPLTVDPMRAVTGWATVRRERPLRLVTVVRGRHVKDNGREDIEGACVVAFSLGDLLPDGAYCEADCLGSGHLCDFRITVEAVPVDEVKP